VPNIDFQWGSGSVLGGPSEDVIVRFTGSIRSNTTQNISFLATADDGTKLYIDGINITNDWYDKGGGGTTSDPISFTAGVPKTIELLYYENGGGANVFLYWDQSGSMDIIPASAFTSQAAPVVKTIGPPRNLTVTDTDTATVLSWEAPNTGNTQPERYAISFSADGGGWGIATGNVGDANALNTTITINHSLLESLKPSGTTWTFSIRSDNDTLSLYSEISNQVTLKIGKTAEEIAAEQAAASAAEALIAAQVAAQLAAQQAEVARIQAEAAALIAQQAAAAQAEAERIAAQLAAQEAARIQAEIAAKAESDRIEAAIQAARIQAELKAKAEAERIAEEIRAAEAKSAAEAKAEAERIAAEEEAKRIAAEKEAEEAAAKAKAEEEAIAEAIRQAEEVARLEAERIAAEEEAARLEAERIAAEEAERIATEEAERIATEEADKAKAEKAEADKIAAEEAAEKAEEERLAKIAKDAQDGKELSKEEVALVVTALIANLSPGESISAAQVQASGVSYSDLPASTPIELRTSESGEVLIITAEVAANVELVQDPGALLEAAFTDPGAALAALGSIGADMTPGEREEATDMVVATVVAAGAAINAAAVAAGGGTGGGGSSGGGSSGANSPGSRGGRRW